MKTTLCSILLLSGSLTALCPLRLAAQESTPPTLPSADKAQPAGDTVSYIGVVTRLVTPELRAQFSLPEGFGVLVEEVMPDSPAAAAGLKPHDILLRFNDQRLVNADQLSALVRSAKTGESVSLAVISGGRESTLTVNIGARTMPREERDESRHHGWPGFGIPPFMSDGGRSRNDPRSFSFGSEWGGGDWNEQMRHFNQRMKEYQERLQDWARGPKDQPMPMPPVFDPPKAPGLHPPKPGGPGMPPRGQQQQQHSSSQGHASAQAHADGGGQSHATAHVVRRDESGEYSLRRDGNNTVFTVRPKDGQEQSWPVNNDAERQAVPEKYRDKLRELDHIHVDIRQDGAPADPPPPDADRDTPRPQPRPRGDNRPRGEKV